MDTIQIKDKTFRPYIRREEIKAAIEKIAARINNELARKSSVYLRFERCICLCGGSFTRNNDRKRNHIYAHEILFWYAVDWCRKNYSWIG
ncbi:MAG: hypothetical protein V8R52_03460, partial [Coprobacter fastidiosus]